jgi:hypothetical protein
MQVKLEGLRATAAAVAVAMSVVVGATAVNAADPAQNAGEKESKGSGPDFSVNATTPRTIASAALRRRARSRRCKAASM